MRDADNQAGYHVQTLTESGWVAVEGEGQRPLTLTKDAATTFLARMKMSDAKQEYRIYPALKDKRGQLL